MSYAGCEKTWRKLKCLLLSERIQSEKAEYCIIRIMCHFGKSKNFEDSKKKKNKQTSSCQELGIREGINMWSTEDLGAMRIL